MTAAVPSTLDVVRDGLLTPRGVDHVMLRFTSLEKSLPYYRLVYGPSVERSRVREAGGRLIPAPDEPDVVRFADSNGIVVEVRVAE